MPAVTCTAQASILTGKPPQEHGIVGNGWLFRDTREVRFWQQSSALIEAETLDHAVRARASEHGLPFRVAKLFWWFNQGSGAEISVTPKPHYGADGKKVFGIAGTPDGLCDSLERSLGRFPFHTFWGPKAGLPCTEWIARCAAEIIRNDHPSSHWSIFRTSITTLSGSGRPAVTRLAWRRARLGLRGDSRRSGSRRNTGLDRERVWSLGRAHPVLLNRMLREAGLLKVRPGPFGEVLDTFGSQAFAVCDHQVAHIYLDHASDRLPGASAN